MSEVNDGKSDVGKSMMSLLMVQFGRLNRKVADVLTFGAAKYPRPPEHDSWKYVPHGRRRYIDAMYRHLHQYLVEDELYDDESGINHLAHVMANIHFIYDIDNRIDKCSVKMQKVQK